MGNSEEIAAKAELERQQLNLSVERLKLENAKLAQESKPEQWWSKLIKNVVAFGGVATVAATMYGLYDSYTKTIADRAHTRTAEQRAQFEDAVKRLESPGTVSKLVAVSVLSAYLTPENENFHHQILFTLASLAATEQDIQTQSAVANLVSALPADSISKGNWFDFQDSLASQSRALVIKGDLYRHRQFGLDDIGISSEERTARFVGRLIAIVARKGAAPEYVNYDGIYCVDCDFRNANFSKSASFTGSVLDGANFRGARLEEASFDNADLGGASFVGADLRRAKFRTLSEGALKSQSSTEGAERAALTPYLNHIGALLDTHARITFSMPDFDCSNLEGANFNGFLLIPVPPMAHRTYAKGDDAKPGWYKNVPQFIKDMASSLSSPQIFQVAIIRFPRFQRANLADAQLGAARFYVIYNSGDFFYRLGDGSFTNVSDFSIVHSDKLDQAVLRVVPDDDASREGGTTASLSAGLTASQRRYFQAQLRRMFFQATTNERTMLPAGVAEFLKTAPQRKDEYSGPDCTPRAAHTQ